MASENLIFISKVSGVTKNVPTNAPTMGISIHLIDQVKKSVVVSNPKDINVINQILKSNQDCSQKPGELNMDDHISELSNDPLQLHHQHDDNLLVKNKTSIFLRNVFTAAFKNWLYCFLLFVLRIWLF